MRFRNLDPRHGRPSRWDVMRWTLRKYGRSQKHQPHPGPPAPQVVPDLSRILADDDETRLTWLGHASALLRLGGRGILIDPVFSPKIGWVYPRHAPPGLSPDQLPAIDLVLVTHNHYDHLDAPSIAALPREATIIAPLRLGSWFLRYGFARVVELEWWESFELEGLKATFVPSRHWSRRTPFDTNASLWGGYVLTAGGTSIYHAGDSAVFDGFAEIGRRHPEITAALLPIGGYDPQWFMQHNHFTPEEAGEAFLALGAERFIPIHWGTFHLSDEPLLEPIERLRAWWDRSRLEPERLAALAIGETLPLG